MLSNKASLTVFTITLLIGVCFAQTNNTIIVGSQEEFKTISDAVLAAVDGDLIILVNETFSGAGNVLVDLSNKSLTISGSGSTIIDGLQSGPIFFANASDGNHTVVISFLTIQNAISSGKGGAISFQGHPGLSLTVDNVAFLNNKASHGGAIALEEGGETAILQVISSTFEGNNATYGGAICVRNSSLLIEESSFTHHKAGRGGVLYTDSNSTASIYNSTFFNNTAHMNGGAFYQESTSSIYAFSVSVQSNKAACNCTWHSGSNGGAWYLAGDDTVATVEESSFSFNSATNGGAFAVFKNAVLSLSNTSLDSNSVTLYGGALYVDAASAEIDGSSFTNNEADGGAASYVILATSINVTNSNFAENKASDFGGAFFCQDSHLDFDTNSVGNNTKGDFWCGPQCYASGFCPASKNECQEEKDHLWNLIIVMIVMAIMVAQFGTCFVYWAAGKAQELNAGSMTNSS